MKYHTLSTSSLASEGKKSTLTLYTGPDFVSGKMESSNEAIVRCELEMAQRALKFQTRRCRQLVAEYTRKLQAKELQIISERQLRDEQLSRVLRSLLVFEARLRQEQIFIRHQLGEKDEHIQRQRKELRRLLFAIQLCKTCSQLYSVSNVDSCDSSSEYCVGSQDTCESSSELYTSLSESGRQELSSGEDANSAKITYEKNTKKSSDTLRKSKKNSVHRRTTGTYFEVLKLHENSADSSRDESLSGSEGDGSKATQEIDQVSERIEELFADMPVPTDTFSGRMDSLHGIKKSAEHSEEKCCSPVQLFSETKTKENEEFHTTAPDIYGENRKENVQPKVMITETIPVFDTGEGTTNDDWYASNSEPEDDEQRDIYRNNPVLECMNQILLKNINDSIHSPPKSPEMDRNLKNKTLKKVKFSDENEDTPIPVKRNEAEPIEKTETKSNNDYYETPIQVTNFYEVPQSIYSNDYEQIFNKCGDGMQSWQTSSKMNSPTSKSENLQEKKINRMSLQKLTIAKSNNFDTLESKNHYYIDMDTKCTSPVLGTEHIKKSKITRTPPALPPKPANLVSKFKIQSALRNGRSCENLDSFSLDSEPDYCSISELNLPTEKMIMSKSSVQSVSESQNNLPLYNLISLDGTLPNLAMKNAEKNSMQTPKPQIKSECVVSNIANISQISMLKNKKEPEIPKLPQVSEIIIPDENEEKEKKEDRISQDNYIKNNSQILKQISQNTNDKFRGPIVIGSSVSSLITGFNQHLLSEIGNRDMKPKSNGRMFSNFDKQNYEKQSPVEKKEAPTFEKFDLSQNFEEFNLDDCEIGEEYQSDTSLSYNVNSQNGVPKVESPDKQTKPNTSVEIVRVSKPNPQSIKVMQDFQKNLNTQKNCIIHHRDATRAPVINQTPDASYEHFLECTGLSSKSILTPSRLMSNHKSMLKPKDIKLRNKVRSSAIFEHSGNTVKYWSEPYL